MEHLAILDKKRNLLRKIIGGEKTIESRWYLHKRTPWDKIKEGDTIYFKEGKKVTTKGTASKILQYKDLDPTKIKDILNTHKGIGVGKEFYNTVKNKRYCILIFLKDIKKVQPFEIDKKGYGNMAAWITTDTIDKIKKR